MASRPTKLRLLPRTTVKGKSLTRLAARLLGGDGITVDKANGAYTIALNPATAPDVLGLVIGTDVQAQDADLQALADNVGAGLWAVTGAGTGHVRTITGTANEITLTNGDGVAGNPTASLPSALAFGGKTVTGGTFNSPVINTPTGIVKGDVGLGNVDNTSDATKNAASVTLTNKTISGSANTLSNIALSSHASQAAYTFVGNNSGSSAAPTAVDIAGLSTKASPALGDYVMVSDQAASGAWKKATISSVANAGTAATPIVIFGTGQSNAATALSRSWTPASNAFVWNWDGVDGHVGTAFAALSSTTINPFQKIASEIAYANPTRTVYLINISYTGLAIAQWLVGASGVAMYTNIQNNVVPALAAIGVSTVDIMLYWQGESDIGFPARWRSSFATLTAQLKAETWFRVMTPMALFAIASNANTGGAVWDHDAMNAAIEGAVRDDADVRILINPNQLGIANYNADGLHLIAAGYELCGTLAANAIQRGFGRKPSIIIHPATIAAAGAMGIQLNGDHIISEENLDAAVTGITGTTTYITDQWVIAANGAVVVTGQRITTTPPSGIKYAMRTTITTVDSSIASGDYLYVYTPIEGERLRKLGWGGTGAIPATYGMWVRCSITGTFGVSILNVAGTRSWVDTFTISNANTWEFKCFTVPGEVSGAWVNDNTLAAVVRICLSAGSTFQGSAGTWNTSNIMTTSAQTNFSGTNAATFDFTGFFLLPGADMLESDQAALIMRNRQQELPLCQRHLYVWRSTGAYYGQAGGNASTTQGIIPVTFPVEMRSAPTFSTPDATKFSLLDMAGSSVALTTLAKTGVSDVLSGALLGTVASGLTLGRATVLFANGATAVAKWKAQM
jgi:hypothetical protein